mmetsp:Transcript_18878/g.38334  ORF Transcript_18878/g.38334 Transcript_18878/m.38334 type:complete len:215 (-) Transcript_18878:532-1176(-)
MATAMEGRLSSILQPFRGNDLLQGEGSGGMSGLLPTAPQPSRSRPQRALPPRSCSTTRFDMCLGGILGCRLLMATSSESSITSDHASLRMQLLPTPSHSPDSDRSFPKGHSEHAKNDAQGDLRRRRLQVHQGIFTATKKVSQSPTALSTLQLCAKHALAVVGDVQEAILVLLLIVDVRHESCCGWQHVVDKDEDRLFWCELDALSDHMHKLSDG